MLLGCSFNYIVTSNTIGPHDRWFIKVKRGERPVYHFDVKGRRNLHWCTGRDWSLYTRPSTPMEVHL